MLCWLFGCYYLFNKMITMLFYILKGLFIFCSLANAVFIGF